LFNINQNAHFYNTPVPIFYRSFNKRWIFSNPFKEGDISYKEPENNNVVESLAALYPLKILVAEDNNTNSVLTGLMLESFGYQPDFAENGLEVIEAIKKTKIRPNIDGYTYAHDGWCNSYKIFN
jgi:hypothetical protein